MHIPPPAAIHQIIHKIGATVRLRAMVVDGQRTPAVRFSHAAILARLARPGSDELGILPRDRHKG